MNQIVRNQIRSLFNQSQVNNNRLCNIKSLNSDKFLFEIIVQNHKINQLINVQNNNNRLINIKSNQNKRLINNDVPNIKRDLINQYYQYIIYLLKLINESTSKINVYKIQFFNISGLCTRSMVEKVYRHWFANQILDLQEYRYDPIVNLNEDVINKLNQESYIYLIEICTDEKLIKVALDTETELKRISNQNFNLQSKK